MTLKSSFMKWARGNKTWHAHTALVKERISQKLTPRVTPTTLTGRLTVVVIEVWGDQSEVDVEFHWHAIIVLSRLACRRFLSF